MAAPPAQQTMKPNKEGEILETPLPASWTLQRLQAGELPVRVFGALISPSNFRLRYILKFYKIPFTVSEGFYAKTVDKNWEYKKMPVMRIGTKEDVAHALKTGDIEKGRIINDGYVCIHALAPALQGRPFTEDEVKIEKYFTFGLQYNMFYAAIKAGKVGPPNPSKFCPNNCCKRCRGNCCLGCCLPYCLCPLCCNYICCGGGPVERQFKKDGAHCDGEHVQLKSDAFIAAGKKLADLLGDRDFFASDGNQGLVDVDLFGFIHYNVALLGNPYAIKMIGADSRVQKWYDRMKRDAAGQIDAFQELQFVAPNA